MEAESSQGTRGKKSVRGGESTNNLNTLLEEYLQKTINNGETFNFQNYELKLKILGEGQLTDQAQNNYKFELENLRQSMKEHIGKNISIKKWSFDHQFIENTNQIYVNIISFFEDRKMIIHVYLEGKDQPQEARKQLFLNLKKKIIREKFSQTSQTTTKIMQILQVFNKHIQEVQKEKTPSGKTPGTKTPGGTKTPLKGKSPNKRDTAETQKTNVPNTSKTEEQHSLKIKRIMKVCTKTQLLTYAMEQKNRLPLSLQKEKRCDSIRKLFMPNDDPVLGQTTRKKKCYEKDIVNQVMNLYK